MMSSNSTTTTATFARAGLLSSTQQLHQQLPSHIADPFDLQESLSVGVVSAVFFAYLHYFLRQRYGSESNNAQSHNKSKQQQEIDAEYPARVISWIHAVISTVGSFYALYAAEGALDFQAPATRLQANWQMVTLAYFLQDTAAMLITNQFDLTFFLHHVLSCASLGCGAVFGIYGVIVCAAQLAGECSNPFMHGRWLLAANGFKNNSVVTRWVTKLWFASFFVARCIVSPWLFVKALECMHWAYWPQVAAMIIFSAIFLYKAAKAEMRGEWWVG